MKYRIRDFLWLALAVGLGLGWYVDRRTYALRKPGWTDFEALYDFDPDYQFFEPFEVDDYGGCPLLYELGEVAPFEVRTRNQLDNESHPFQILDSIEDDAQGDLPTEPHFNGLGPNWCGWGN
jgi:hypothetical protein